MAKTEQTVKGLQDQMVEKLRQEIKKEVLSAPTRIDILNAISMDFRMFIQWCPGHPSNMMEYKAQAESLINLLEAFDCGSCGGYDKANPVIPKYGPLYDRFMALARKHKNQEDLDDNLDSIGKLYMKIHRKGMF